MLLQNRLKYIITGTGRCSTMFCAYLLTQNGIPCGHEAIFTNKGITKIHKLSDLSERKLGKNWVKDIVSDSSYLAAPFLKKYNVPTIHLIRNPLEVISSFVRGLQYFWNSKPNNEYEEFIYQHVPELTKSMFAVERASLYYLKWNEMIENNANNRIVHDIREEKILDFIKPKQKINAVEHIPFYLEDIKSLELRERIRLFAESNLQMTLQ